MSCTKRSLFRRAKEGRDRLGELGLKYIERLYKVELMYGVWNTSSSVGHMFSECDYLLREVGQKSRGVLALNGDSRSREFSRLFSSRHIIIRAANVWYSVFCRIGERSGKGVLDIGLGDRDIEKRVGVKQATRQQRMDYVFSKQHVSYYNSFRDDYFPLREALKKQIVDGSLRLVKEYGLEAGRYVTVMRKEKVGNGTVALIKPEVYRKAFVTLRASGIKIVWVGRERCPKDLKEEFDILEYSTSKKASLARDVMLTLLCKFAISDASGYGAIPSTLGIPLLVLNNVGLWAPPGRKTVCMPPRLKVKKRLLTLKEQYEFMKDNFQGDYKEMELECIGCSGEDLRFVIERMIEVDGGGDLDAGKEYQSHLKGIPEISAARYIVPDRYWARIGYES